MSTALARLAWKDAALVWPILAVIVAATVVFNALILAAWYVDPQQAITMIEFATITSCLLPGVLAFGLPAMLIGTEQESGTLNWLRSLAVPRRLVINSKVLVAVVSLAIAWAFGFVVSRLVYFVLQPVFVAENLHSANTISAITLYLTLQLLLTGFITCYLFRSPITGLLAAVPAMILVAIFDGWIGHWYENRHLSLPGFLLLGASALLLLWCLQYWLAERRLRPAKSTNIESKSRYAPSRMLQFSTVQNEHVYQLNFELRLPIPKLARASGSTGKRPSIGRAMLWQAATQQFLAVSVLALPCLLAVFLFFSRGDNPAILLTILPICWIGCLTFYHDSLNRRYLFYGERGFSISRVWITRMALPVSVVLLALVWNILIVNRGYLYGTSQVWLFSSAIVFACGALASIWVARPVLAFLVAPVLAVFTAISLGSGLQPYPDYVDLWSLAAIPILFATWRLQRRWMNGQRNLGFHWRCLAYVLLGPLVVYGSVYGHRFATMPKEIPQWRAATLAEASKITFEPSPETSEALLNRYREASLAIGVDVNIRKTDNRRELLSLLLVSRQVRQAVIDGQIDPQFILTQVERDEAQSLSELQSLQYSYPWIVTEIVEQIPSGQIRRESRRLALLAAWQSYQTQSWDVEGGDQRMYRPKTFAGLSVCPWRYKLTFEQTRADRTVDLATQATLEYVEHGNVHSDTSELTLLWQEALGPYVDSRKSTPISLEADKLIARFRELASRDQYVGQAASLFLVK